jgi:hypothetical protein
VFEAGFFLPFAIVECGHACLVPWSD